MPNLLWCFPFVALLGAIAVLPLVPRVAHWWEKNLNKLFVSGVLSFVICLYYAFRGEGVHHSEPGLDAVASILDHSVLREFFPFIVLLFSLFTISGGIRLSGDIPAHPTTNLILIVTGTLLASFIGTTGASMLLIRPLLEINSERKNVVHTVVFFIFLVSNIGGSLLPVGDPPLFLGYLRGVPFLWTFQLFKPWLFCIVILFAVYWIWDTIAYRREGARAIYRDETIRAPIRLVGKFNFLLLAGVVAAVAVLVPGKNFPGTEWTIPDIYLREWVQLALAALSMAVTSKTIRELNKFSFHAIAEVACLFIGIFITLQVPIEILHLRGTELGMSTPAQFFWATGVLSSFLDNAPTYVVFFETAGSLPVGDGVAVVDGLQTATGAIPVSLLLAISCGAVFMGANTYIGNGPNFMVKAIAEQGGVRMPSFFGFMIYSGAVLLPLFFLVTVVFFRG